MKHLKKFEEHTDSVNFTEQWADKELDFENYETSDLENLLQSLKDGIQEYIDGNSNNWTEEGFQDALIEIDAIEAELQNR